MNELPVVINECCEGECSDNCGCGCCWAGTNLCSSIWWTERN